MASLRSGVCAFLAFLLGFVSLAQSDVKVATGPDGRKIIYNETPAQHARRFSNRMAPVPDAALVPLIERHSQLQNLDPKLVRALIQAESGYNQHALSNKGAMGLMQLMPTTASLLRVSDPWDAEENVRGGTIYLRQLLDRFQGRLEWAVAAYNAGPRAVERHGGIPPYPETREYVRRVLALYQGTEAVPARFTIANPGGSRVSVSTAPAGSPVPVIKRKPRIIRNSENQIVVTTALE
ncbi:MAG TPA: lytic transglycosylase domain-containing protein [Thermoanaerobaculia bacterium]|nr:lytic transglycosylase domain-containing protein [Thermoanaerobaculia bacterium]